MSQGGGDATLPAALDAVAEWKRREYGVTTAERIAHCVRHEIGIVPVDSDVIWAKDAQAFAEKIIRIAVTIARVDHDEMTAELRDALAKEHQHGERGPCAVCDLLRRAFDVYT